MCIGVTFRLSDSLSHSQALAYPRFQVIKNTLELVYSQALVW